jgi:thioredoxin family protein
MPFALSVFACALYVPPFALCSMKSICLAAALAAAVQTSAAKAPAQLFDQGQSFTQFLAHVSAQRELWVRNAGPPHVAHDDLERLTRVSRGLELLIVAEDWCPDSVYTVPYVANLASAAGVPVRILDRTMGDALMAAHPARDGRKVTPTIVLLRNGRDVGAWVERPAILQEAFFSMATNPASARLFAARASWYEGDQGRTAIAEILALAERSAP